MTDNTQLRQDLDDLLARVSMNWSSWTLGKKKQVLLRIKDAIERLGDDQT
jgi:hypothetical protein